MVVLVGSPVIFSLFCLYVLALVVHVFLNAFSIHPFFEICSPSTLILPIRLIHFASLPQTPLSESLLPSPALLTSHFSQND